MLQQNSSLMLPGFLLQAPSTKEFWHDPYLCILGHTNIITPSCASDAKVQLPSYSNSWICSYLLGTTVHLMSALVHRLKYFVAWQFLPGRVCLQASTAYKGKIIFFLPCSVFFFYYYEIIDISSLSLLSFIMVIMLLKYLINSIRTSSGSSSKLECISFSLFSG